MSMLKKAVPLIVVIALARTDYPCQGNYVAQCYDCLYNANICHRAGSGSSTLYKNGQFYAVDLNEADWASSPKEAMLVEDGKIKYIGTLSGAQSLVKAGTTRTVDLMNNLVLPGIHDNHMHPLEASSAMGGTCKLPPNTKPDSPLIADLFNVQYCQGNQVGTDWILGHGHSIGAFLEYLQSNPSRSPKDILDDLVVDENGTPLPAIMMEETSHSAWVNSKALERAGIDETVVDENGSVYMKSNGILNGIILENAVIAMMEKALNVTEHSKLKSLAIQGLRNALFSLAENGITSAVDARNYWQRENEKAYETLLMEKNLTAKVILSMWAYPENDDTYQINELKKYFKNDKTSRLRQSQIKVYMDGLVGTRTAVVLDAYKDSYPNLGIGNHGLNYFTQARLQKYVSQLQGFKSNGEGYNFLIHAVGDGGVRQALEAINSSPTTQSETPRHKITHCEMVHADDLAKFHQYGVIADPQVSGNFTLPTSGDHKDFVRLIGAAKADKVVPVKSLLDNNALVTLSSDWDVSTLNPFVGMSHAINRGPQSVTLKDAIEMYTINGAYSMRQEDKTGSLEVGKDADFIVINQDIFNLEATNKMDDIMKTKVLYTVLEGEEIWRNGI